jgi:hypothetical protein
MVMLEQLTFGLDHEEFLPKTSRTLESWIGCIPGTQLWVCIFHAAGQDEQEILLTLREGVDPRLTTNGFGAWPWKKRVGFDRLDPIVIASWIENVKETCGAN